VSEIKKEAKTFGSLKEPGIHLSYITIQCLMLVLRYGFNKPMPWWATWFPSIITGGIVLIVLAVAFIGLVVGIIGLVFDK
jgi:hypothetical protein